MATASATGSVVAIPAEPIVDRWATVGAPNAPLRSTRAVVVVESRSVDPGTAVVEGATDVDDDAYGAVRPPPEHAASIASARSCAPMETLLSFLAVAGAAAALVWALRVRPARMAKDGSWFDCEYQIVELESPIRQDTRWRAGRAVITEQAVTVHVGPARRTASLGASLPVAKKLDSARRRHSVFLLGDEERAVTISVARGSAAEQRLDSLLAR